MKKYFAFALLFFLVSCGAKKIVNQTSNTTKIDSVVTEKTTVTEVNNAITDSIIKKIEQANTNNKNCDSLCNLEIDKILSQLEFYKKSGSSEYQILYDQLKKQLTITGKLQKTINEINTEKQDKLIVREIENRVEIPIKQPLPKWQIVLMTIGAIIPFGFLVFVAIYVYRKIRVSV